MIIEKGSTIDATPVYGYGWRTCATNESIDVPEPFTVCVMEYEETESEMYIVGEVETAGHRFGKFAILMSLRTRTPDTLAWNVRIYKDIRSAFEKIQGMSPECVCTGFVHTTMLD